VTINERMKIIRKDKKLSQEDFGKIIDVKKSGVSLIESGRNSVHERHIKALVRELGVNEVWLRTGKGDKYYNSKLDKDVQDFIDKLKSDPSRSKFETRFFTVLSRLDDKEWELLSQIAQSLSDMEREKKEASCSGENPLTSTSIPLSGGIVQSTSMLAVPSVQYSPIPSDQDKEHLMPIAAHERTDIEQTDEDRQHDDDIMKNDDEW